MQDSINAALAAGLREAKSQHALKASEAGYRRLFETAQDGILILDASSGLIIDVNPFLIDLLDLTREDFIGKNLWELGPFKNVDASKAAFRELQNKKYVRYDDLPLETRSGRAVSVEFVSNVYDVDGMSVIQCNIRDITARKHAEEVQGQLRQYQKMEAIGQLAGGIAHDFNNLLGVIMGYCDVLTLEIPAGDPMVNMVEQIHFAGSRAATLTRQLLAFSRRQVLKFSVLDLNRVVSDLKSMLQRLIGEQIEIVTSLEPDLGCIKADPSQMELILMNLAVNARDAMSGRGMITIKTASVELDEKEARRENIAAGSYVLLSVTDTGVGMNNKVLSRVFEPFFTTKHPGKGTGLGLATVYGIVKQSAGHISVRSEPGKGTTFNVYLPRVQQEVQVTTPAKEEAVGRGSETILLVEDYAPLRGLTRQMLQRFGYTVLEAGVPSAAILVAGQHDGLIGLLITDVAMPETNGWALAEKLAVDRPEMKVLFMSGYRYGVGDQQSEFPPNAPLIDKPFTRSELGKTVRAILDAPAQQMFSTAKA